MSTSMSTDQLYSCIRLFHEYEYECSNSIVVVEYLFMSMSTYVVWVLQLLYSSLFHEYEYEYSNSIVVVEYLFMSTSMSTPTL